jgi:predicted Fe-Mo cluster-binding NifX family protein
MHPCIFCPKSQKPQSQPHALSASPAMASSMKAHRVAVPVFMGRVSPVLDTCNQLYVIDPEGQKESARRMIRMKSASILERVRELNNLGVGLVICGAVSEFFFNLLREADIELVCDIAGDVDDVIEAYYDGSLRQPRFRMPGCD